MTLTTCSWLIFAAVAAAATSSSAAEITGKVRDVSGDGATIVIDGDALPAVGDSAEIFFKVPGAEEEISVASGTVASVEAKVVKIKIEHTSGTIEKDHLARIKSGSVPTTAGASPSPAASSSVTAPTAPSIVGDWVCNTGHDGIVSLGFKADGTLLWVVEEEKSGMSTLAKYRINPSTKPQTIEIFDFEESPLKGEKLFGIFEFQNDGRLKLDFEDKEPPKEFTNKAVVFSKATSPVVRSNKPPPPPPTPYVAPVTPPDEKLLEEGKDLFRRKDYDGAIKAYTKAIELNPKNANAFYWRGVCFSEMKNEAAELADYEKAQALDPTMRLQTLIDAMKQTQRVDQELATESPTPATATAPSPEVRQLIDKGVALKDLGELDAAVSAFTKAIKLDPKAVDAYFWRGSCYDLQNKHGAAIRDWNEVMNLDPSQRESRQKLMEELHWEEKAKKEQRSKKR